MENNYNETAQQELISVIIPVYNVEKYLERCLNSALNQTYKNLEIILIDDGSTDASGKLCDEYAKKDKRVKVIHKENGGQSSARNVGLDIAKGKYIGFLDSDDWITSDMYEYLYQLMKKEDVDISMCSFTRNPKKLQLKNDEEFICRYSGNKIADFFYRLNGEPSFYSVWNRLYKREILRKTYFLENKITEDVYFTYQVYERSESIAISNLKKYLYFKNQEGTTRSHLSLKDLSLFEIWDMIFEIENRKQSEYVKWAELNRKRATFTLYTKAVLYGCDNEIKKDILKQWKKEIKGNYRELMQGRFLDLKRKAFLFVLYILP